MVTSAFETVLVLAREDGTPLQQEVVGVDWEPAVEWTRLSALRRGQAAVSHEARVEPLWHEELGAPYVQGFRLVLAGEGDDVAGTFANDYLRDLAQAKASALVARGELVTGQRFRYVVMAQPSSAAVASPARVRFRQGSAGATETSKAALDGYLGRASFVGVPNETDLPVFVPRPILQELTTLYRAAGARETGGILVGHLRQDPAVPEVFLEMTAQVPARRAEAGLAHLTFTAETWTDVRAALALRRRGEVWLGWWHTHPAREWSEAAHEAEKERGSAAQAEVVSGAFFSSHDIALHRTVFFRGYCVGLVVSDLGSEQETFSLFGWRDGRVVNRGFHVLEEAA